MRIRLPTLKGTYITSLKFLWRIRYGFYIKNFLEKKKNREKLREIRLKNSCESREPLVSVTIPTYNRAKLLTEVTIPSVLRQTYPNFELVIVGDHCTDDTEERLKKIKDERIRFYNLPEQGKYPDNPLHKWMVAGTVPMNKAVEMSSGDWIAPLNDDDEFTDDHIESLLKFALEKDYEMVYGKVNWEVEPDRWQELGSYPLEIGKISAISVLYNSKLKFIKYSTNNWKYLEPFDWNLWRRMKEAGVKIGFLDKVIGIHYLEGTMDNISDKFRL